MGKVMSVIAYQFKNYNIERRAHKVISQAKPVMAPKYKDNLKDLERVLKDYPEIVEESSRKDKGHDDRLKNVFVTTSHIVDQKRILNPERPLPTSKEFAGYFELGYKEPDSITPGKCTLKQVLQFLGDYRLHPDEWTPEKIALHYKMKLEDVKNLLEYYKIFSLYVPPQVDEKKRKQLKTEYDTRNFNQILKQSTERIKFLNDENPGNPQTQKRRVNPTHKDDKKDE